MLNSVPVVLQAAVWPLIGAAIILTLGRFLPNRLRRLIAMAAALASMVAIRSVVPGDPSTGTLHLSWDPIGFFRMGPAFEPSSLGLLFGRILALLTAVATLALNPRDQNGWRTPWHGLMLLALAGCQLLAMSANLLTLTLASGLLCMGIMALAAFGEPDETGAPGWPAVMVAAPGIFATLLLAYATLQADVQQGHASLVGRTLPDPVLVVVGMAGLLWVLTYVVKAVNTPERSVALLLPAGAGFYLLARVQAISPALSAGRPGTWILVTGLALLLGGSLLAWLKGVWPGLPAQQLGLTLTYVWMLGGQRPTPLPWPWVASTLSIGLLGAWWASQRPAIPPPPWPPLDWLARRVEPWRARLRAWLTARTVGIERWRGSWLGQRQAAFWPAVALLSVAGVPLTAGAIGRWRFYGEILSRGQAAVLLLILAADVLVCAAVWTALGSTLQLACQRRLAPSTVLAMLGLGLPLLVWGLAPAGLDRAVGLAAAPQVDVSGWGIGLLFFLPWLIGAWLAFVTARGTVRLEGLRRLTGLAIPAPEISWLGRRLVAGLHWLSQVGEGEGWWGWALILLALAAIFLVAR